MAILASAARRRAGGGPLADQFTGLEVVGGEGHVGGVDRVERRVERDHQKAGVAGLLDRGTMAAVSDAVSRMPLAPSAMQVSMACDLGLVVAVDLAGIGLELDAQFFGLGGGAFAHLHEEGVGVGLGDQAGAR
jgi:hypothetical protein